MRRDPAPSLNGRTGGLLLYETDRGRAQVWAPRSGVPRRLVASAALCLAALLALGGTAILLERFWDGFTFVGFFDETTHMLGAQVVSAGGILYRDFIDSHGPVVFMLSQAYGAVFGWTHHKGARILVAGLACLAVALVAVSPALATERRANTVRPSVRFALPRLARLWAVALFVGLLQAAWLRQALDMLSFYPIGGALAAIGIAGFVAGAWRGAPLPRSLAFASGGAFGLLAGVAYSFWPSVALFALSGVWPAWRDGERRAVLWFAAGLASGLATVVAYLLIFGDVIGYLVYHIVESQAVYSRFIGFSWQIFLASLLPHWAPASLMQTLTVIVALVGLLACLAHAFLHRTRNILPILAGFVALLGLNARGMGGFQDATFMIPTLALAALGIAALAADIVVLLPMPEWGALATGLVVFAMMAGSEAAARHAHYAPFDLTRKQVYAMPRWPINGRTTSPFWDRVRELVHPDERMLALNYDPGAYLDADRLPMRGIYAWFAWDQAFSSWSVLGRRRDLCDAIESERPPVILYDDYPIFGYDAHQYVPCLFSILARDYVLEDKWHDMHGALYVRRDRAS